LGHLLVTFSNIELLWNGITFLMSSVLSIRRNCTGNRTVPKNDEVVGYQSSHELPPWNNGLGYSCNQLCHQTSKSTPDSYRFL
jgi:hypothetical protein